MHRILSPLVQLMRVGVRNMACQRLNESSAKALLEGIDSVLFDCDGVLWDGRGAIPGSLETVEKLMALGKKVFYITNNSSRSRAEYLEKCKHFGYQATVDQIVCTAFIAALYLKNHKFEGKVYVVGNPAMGTELDACGISHTGIGPEAGGEGGSITYWINKKWDPEPDVMDGALTDLIDKKWDTEIKCVLVGFDPDISYKKIMYAASYLQRPECLFLGTNEDTHLPVKDTETRIPGTGTMVMAVAYPSQRKPIILGKPQPYMFEELRKLHNLDPARCLMVGDRLESDIGLAKSCDLKSLLVLTGVTSEEELLDLKQADGENLAGSSSDAPTIPDFYSTCLGDFGNFI